MSRRLVSLLLWGLPAILLGTAGGPAAARIEVDLATDPDAVRMDGEEILDQTGARMASCDVNGDGIEDLIIGAPDADGPSNSRFNGGEVYVVFGGRHAWTGPRDLSVDRDVWIYAQRGSDRLADGLACGDLDGDGYDDMVLCAPYADRWRPDQTTGQAHVIFGGPELPPEIDLLADPGLVIRGEFDNGRMCQKPAIADVNGDGRLDLILDDHNAKNRAETKTAGRVYVLFGRSNWPAEIDLRDHAQVDVLIYGPAGPGNGDRFAANVTAGDLDGDGVAELIVDASAGDGPNDSRSAAGDVHVFWGRLSWPHEIDLETERADLLLFGPDPSDSAGSVHGLAVANLDGDLSPELLVGIHLGDGSANDAPSTGELRRVEFGYRPSRDLDLASDYDSVIWGADAGDQFASWLGTGDVNGDGQMDVAAAAAEADGPANMRDRAGEVSVSYGTYAVPAEIDLGAAEDDLIVYGPQASSRLFLVTLSDINNDGLKEVAAGMGLGSQPIIPSVWLVSPYDIDGDGITQLPDNCPLVFNPDQLDSDGDLRGDACQSDWDGDGQEDAADCAPADPSAGTPAEVSGLGFTAGSRTELSWDAAVFADAYDVSRGDLAALDGSDYGSCQSDRDPDRTDTVFDDPDVPASGSGFFYLVRGLNATCPAAGTWGRDSSGAERTNSNPAACTP